MRTLFSCDLLLKLNLWFDMNCGNLFLCLRMNWARCFLKGIRFNRGTRSDRYSSSQICPNTDVFMCKKHLDKCNIWRVISSGGSKTKFITESVSDSACAEQKSFTLKTRRQPTAVSNYCLNPTEGAPNHRPRSLNQSPRWGFASALQSPVWSWCPCVAMLAHDMFVILPCREYVSSISLICLKLSIMHAYSSK